MWTDTRRRTPTSFLGLLVLVAVAAFAGDCRVASALPELASGEETFAELRTIKGEITVSPVAPGPAAAGPRRPYPRERIAEGEAVTLAVGGLAWLRRDAGAIILVSGPARLVLHRTSLAIAEGRAFVDTNGGPPMRVEGPHGSIELSDARASIDAKAAGTADVYVLRGSARAGSGVRAGPGERLSIAADGSLTHAAEIAWEDWTGGLATADPQSEPAPFGVGTVGARPPGDQGKPRFSLVVQRLDVRVSVDHDLAVTEVDETFVNPSSATVEGLYSFRTPPGAVLQRFGVDRKGDLVWGKVKESAAALAQYQSNVYAGSTEDPALLQWLAPGVYSARLYPIEPGAQRRVVTRYAEWLPRQGPKGDRRLYIYPMAAEGARGSLPRIEELTVNVDLARSGATRVRAGMGGTQDGAGVLIKAFDVVPLADLAVELFDAGQPQPFAYRAPHGMTSEDAPEQAEPGFAAKVSREEPDYLLVPVRATGATEPPQGVDLALVVDTSAATEVGALSVARSLASALLEHLGPADRAALWAGDAKLHPVADGSGALTTVDEAKRRTWLEGLAAAERGGATDLGALLTDAASQLDPKRRGAVIYIGDGQPSVGEIAPKALRERLVRLPSGTRLFAAALGSRANVALLSGVTRGAPVEIVGDAYGAARSALRLLEAAYQPAWTQATLDLGPGIERVLPRELPAVGTDEGVVVVVRIIGTPPQELTLRAGDQVLTQPLHVVPLVDGGDLRRRWGQGRLAELLEEGAGRAAIVDIGRRYGLVSPFTSLYVPTARETEQVDDVNLSDVRDARRRRWKPWLRGGASSDEPVAATVEVSAVESQDRKEGGRGTRAKGEEGSMGDPNARAAGGVRYGVRATAPPSAPAMDPGKAREEALKETAQFGMIGLLKQDGDNAPAAPWGRDGLDDNDLPLAGERAPAAATANAVGGAPIVTALPGANHTTPSPRLAASAASQVGIGGPGLSGAGDGGGGKIAAGAGFGGLTHGTRSSLASVVHEGPVSVSGRLPPEVIQRIVRQNYGRFRVCYQNAAASNPTLQGRVTVKFVIDRNGGITTASDGGSDLPDRGVIDCVVRSFTNLAFPQPEGGIVTVSYPLQFAPSGGAAAAGDPGVSVQPVATLAAVGHVAQPCGAAADLPFDDRRVLWRERLAGSTTASSALDVYRRALAECEAPTWRERSSLLVTMVDRLGTVRERVALWRALLGGPAADLVYRSLVVRVQTAADLKALHDALGLRGVDPDLLATLLAKAKSPTDRLAVLHAAALKWPDDLELSLRVLDAYEDAGDDAGGRAWARRIRHRADATAHVYTNVGEYYLRLSSRQLGPPAQRDADEARRTFGELVEFAPEDPVARRRLGDLLRAHGWYEESFRQYETLAQLTPDDASVPLLLAAAAQGMGRIEEAVSWAEKAAASGSPDGSSAVSRAARANASAFLSWALDEAIRAQHKDDADRLRARARRVAGRDAASAGSVRLLVTWSHPELHPVLWTNALGAPMPSADSFPLYGVSETVLPASPDPVIELRLDPDDAARAARLGATVVVTAITGEGTEDERVVRLDVGFGDAQHGPLALVRVRLQDGSLRAEAP
jgi:Ca-activated chloride channel family protein